MIYTKVNSYAIQRHVAFGELLAEKGVAATCVNSMGIAPPYLTTNELAAMRKKSVRTAKQKAVPVKRPTVETVDPWHFNIARV